MPSPDVDRIARLLGEEVQVALRYLETRHCLLSKTPASAIETTLEHRILTAVKTPRTKRLEIRKSDRFSWQVLQHKQCLGVRFRVCTFRAGTTVVNWSGQDLLCLVAIGRAHVSQSGRMVVESVD